MILINRLSKKSIICSMAYAAKIIGRTSKTIGLWSNGDGSHNEKDNGVYKEYGIWELYFHPEEVKQEKGYRIRPREKLINR